MCENEWEENEAGGRGGQSEAVPISPGRDDEALNQVSGCTDG